MSKPSGLSLGIGEDGLPHFQVNRATRTEDAIWDAVETAINEGWTPEQFRNEAADAWAERLEQDAKDARKVLQARA